MTIRSSYVECTVQYIQNIHILTVIVLLYAQHAVQCTYLQKKNVKKKININIKKTLMFEYIFEPCLFSPVQVPQRSSSRNIRRIFFEIFDQNQHSETFYRWNNSFRLKTCHCEWAMFTYRLLKIYLRTLAIQKAPPVQCSLIMCVSLIDNISTHGSVWIASAQRIILPYSIYVYTAYTHSYGILFLPKSN